MIKIREWTFDFEKMICSCGPITHKLLAIDGQLHYRWGDQYRLLTNTGHDWFDNGVNKVWTDHCFEQEILLNK